MSRVRLVYDGDGTCAAGIKVYVNGERVYQVYEIHADESRENVIVYRTMDGIYAEFDAEIEWVHKDGNKIMNLRNIRGI